MQIGVRVCGMYVCMVWFVRVLQGIVCVWCVSMWYVCGIIRVCGLNVWYTV